MFTQKKGKQIELIVHYQVMSLVQDFLPGH